MTFGAPPPPDQGPWFPSAGAVPGSLGQTGDPVLVKRFATIGLVSLILAILEILYCLQKLVSAALTGPLLAFERKMLPPSSAAAMTGALASAQDMAGTIAGWEALRSLPFTIASGFLVWIAVRLRRGDRAALGAARAWSWWALGVVAASSLLQVLVIVPITLAYAESIARAMPAIPTGRGGAPFDFRRTVDSVMLVSTVLTLLGGVVLLSIWPVALRLWAGRLQRETAPPGG